MKSCFALILTIIIGNVVWGQLPSDSLHYYELSELENVNPDTVYAIDLSRNRLKEVPPELSRFKNLKGLNLSKNKLTDLPAFFTTFKNLEFLYLKKNKFTHFPAKIFHLDELRYLDISRNKITSIPAGIKNLEKLIYFDFWDNRLTSITSHFKELQQLTFIDFRGTTFSESFVEKWTLAFPNATVKFDNSCSCLD